MGMLGAGISGGIGQDMLRQREEGFQAEQAQRDRESAVFKTLLSSNNPQVVAMGMSGLMNPASRGGKGGKDAYMQIVHPSPALQQAVDFLHGSTTTSTVPNENAPAAPGATSPTLPGGQPPPVPPTVSDAAGSPGGAIPDPTGSTPQNAVQQTAPAAPGPPSAGMAPTAIDSKTAGPPPQPGWQTTTPLPGQTQTPQVSSVTRPNTLGISPAEQAASMVGPEVARARAMAPIAAQQSGAEELSKEYAKFEAMGLIPEGTTQRAIARFFPAVGGPPPGPSASGSASPMDLLAGTDLRHASDAQLLKMRLAGLLPPPAYRNVTPGTSVPYERLNPEEKAEVDAKYAGQAGPGWAFSHEQEMWTKRDEFNAIARAGLVKPEDFKQDIELTGAPISTDKPAVRAQIDGMQSSVMAQVNSALARNDPDTANRALSQFRQDVNLLRTQTNPDVANTKISVIVGGDVGKKTEPQDPAKVNYWADQALMDSKNFSNMPGDTALKDAVSTELARRGVPITNLDANSRQQALAARDVSTILPEFEREAKQVNDLKLMGPVGGRWAEFLNGKIGASELAGGNAQNAELLNRFLGNAKFLTGALGRMHFGMRGGLAGAAGFEDMLGTGWKDYSGFKGSLDAAKDWVKTYSAKLPQTAAGLQGGPPKPPGGSTTGGTGTPPVRWVVGPNGALVKQ
jgi:hypothetical protein